MSELEIGCPNIRKALLDAQEVLGNQRYKIARASADIKILEDSLRDSVVLFEFKTQFDEGYLSWTKGEGGKFRIFYSLADVHKPLIETKAEVRLKMFEHLPAFIERLAQKMGE